MLFFDVFVISTQLPHFATLLSPYKHTIILDIRHHQNNKKALPDELQGIIS
jgi:hypothetical protein